jgi:hypothetical protein
MKDMKNAYKILTGKCIRRKTLGGHKHSLAWEGDIKNIS